MSNDEANTNGDQQLQLDEDSPSSANTIHGLLVHYQDDQLNECLKTALERKSRVRYKCMDVFLNFLAFGTSGGAIYLFRLKTVSHSSCTLSSMIPCDQGSIEVIKFLPNPQIDDLLVAIGTSRGSVVVFRLSQAPGEQSPTCTEIYKAESFTNNSSIKLMEFDQDLFDTSLPFTKLYICDAANRLYVLESSTIHAARQSLRYFYSNPTPSLVFSVNDSNINQVSAHRGQLLISTNETTRLFSEQSNQLNVIGKKKRRQGFYGACFFNPNYKPNKLMMQMSRSNQQVSSAFASTYSLAELESLLIFVARPVFRLWQVNHQRAVMFTHQFESLIKADRYAMPVELHNEPLSDSQQGRELDGSELLQNFDQLVPSDDIQSDHFEKLVPIYSSTLGNLILSYTQHDLFVVDPIGAKLIVSHHQSAPIVQVCNNENELFVWSRTSDGQLFHVQRLLLLAPTQFVLELHRIHRYAALISFVQLFTDIFCKRMALPLHGTSVITTEGGLLRNVLLNAWDVYLSSANDASAREHRENLCARFKQIVDEIVEEGNQLRKSIENLTDSRFFLTMTAENIDRLCSEPYTSLVSLEVSLLDLHSSHVIHFSKEALNRHKSVANLSQSIKNQLSNRNQTTKSTYDLSRPLRPPVQEERQPISSKVIVERQRTKRSVVGQNARSSAEQQVAEQTSETDKQEVPIDIGPFFSSKSRLEDRIVEQDESWSSSSSVTVESNCASATCEAELDALLVEKLRCDQCHWPRARAHLEQLDGRQQRQLSWMEENLMGNFVENIDEIEDRSFKCGLWNLYLKCLVFKNELDLYITCCLALDDVRLLDIEKFVIRRCSEEEVTNKLFAQLTRKLELAKRLDELQPSWLCLKCESVCPTTEQATTNDEISFNLVNLTERLLSRRNANMRKVIACLLGYPDLLQQHKVPIGFYLRAVEIAVKTVGRSPIGRTRLAGSQVRADAFGLS